MMRRRMFDRVCSFERMTGGRRDIVTTLYYFLAPGICFLYSGVQVTFHELYSRMKMASVRLMLVFFVHLLGAVAQVQINPYEIKRLVVNEQSQAWVGSYMG